MQITLVLDENDMEKMYDLFDRIRQVHFRLERPLRTKAADRIRLGFQRNFETESGGGEPWDDLAPRTVDERRSGAAAFGWPISPAHPILRRTGSLRDSVVNKQSPMHICESSANWSGIEVSIGSADPRFELLHAGGINEEGYSVPARPMTVLSDADMAGLRDTLEWIASEWAKVGF